MIGKKMEGGMVSNGSPGEVRAILGKGSEFEGKLKFEGTVRIDGKFKGEIHSAGTLIIGEHATIDGEVEVESAIVSGQINGNIAAKTRIEMHAPARMSGNLRSPVLMIQEGVIFDGNCQMSKEGAKAGQSQRPAYGADQLGRDRAEKAEEPAG